MQSKNFKEILLKDGVKDPIIIAPLAKIVFRKFSGKALEKMKTFVVSSSNAIEAIKRNKIFLSHLCKECIPIYCVGKHTVERAKDCGLNGIFLGLTASDLVENLGKKRSSRNFHFKTEEMCYLRGEQITLNLAKCLDINERIVYAQIENEIDPEIVIKTTTGEVGHIFFFSSNTVDLFFNKINAIETAINIFCFSENIRNKVIDRIGYDKDNVYFVERSTIKDMVDLFLSKK